MMKSVVVLLALAAFCVARRVDPFSPGVVDSETQDIPVDTVYQPTSIAFQDYQGMMSEDEAKEILGEKLLSNLEEIGVKEVLRENGMEHISESDADRIVTAAEELVGDQINGGTKLMVGKSEAEDILSNYDEKLQEIGAEKVLESLASVGSMVSDSSSQNMPGDAASQAERVVDQPTSIAFQDYQGMMSEDEAKEILGEKLLSNLEEIGVKEVLRENGMEHISESDADRIVTAAEELVGDQINSGTKLMVGKSEAEDILSNYDQKLQEIGAEKVLKSLTSVGSMVSDSSSQSMPGDAASQAEHVVDLPRGMVQESSSQNNMLWEKFLDSIEHPHASSLEKKTAQDQEVRKSVGHFSDSLLEDNAHQSIKDRELARETPRKMAGNHGSQQANREGLLQRAKHQLAHIMHMDGSQSRPHHIEEAPKHVSQSQMPKNSGHGVSRAFHNYRKHSPDGTDKMIANIGAKKIVSVANMTSAHDQYGLGKTVQDFTEIVHNIGSEKSKALYLNLLSSLSEHHAEKDGRSSAVDSGVAGGAFEAMDPEPSLAPMYLPSFLQVEQSVHKANGTSKVTGHAISGKSDVMNISSNVTSMTVSEKMHEHAVSGVKEVAAPSASSTKTMNEKEKIVHNSTGASKAVTNDSLGHAGGEFEAMDPETSLAPMYLPSFLQVEQSVYKANGTSKVIGHAVRGKSDVMNISSNVTSMTVSEKMLEHAVIGVKELAAPSASSTTKTMNDKEKIVHNSTGASKAVTNDSLGHAGGRDVAANATSGAKSVNETKTMFHVANVTFQAENHATKAIHVESHA